MNELDKYKEYSELDFLLLFRRAKRLDTLDIMFKKKYITFLNNNIEESIINKLINANNRRIDEINYCKFVNSDPIKF